MLNTIIYAAGLPSKPMKWKVLPWQPAHVKKAPAPLLIANEPKPPAIVPIPVIVAIVDLGNISPMVEYRLADQA